MDKVVFTINVDRKTLDTDIKATNGPTDDTAFAACCFLLRLAGSRQPNLKEWLDKVTEKVLSLVEEADDTRCPVA